MRVVRIQNCGFRGCTGCSACDPDGSPSGGEESELQRMQRQKRERDKALAEGKPTLRVKLADFLRATRGS